MPISLGNNIASMRARRTLGTSSLELGKIFERLASGKRINRSSDDAAGLAISESLKADTRVFTKGIRNLSDGLSILQISDSAINQLGSIITRLTELSEQSANGVYSNIQRSAINEEVTALQAEYQRILDTTEFNGTKVFNNSIALQAGYGEQAILSIAITQIGDQVGNGSFGAAVTISTVANPGEMNLDDFNNDGVLDYVYGNAGTIRVALGLGNGEFGSENAFVTVSNNSFSSTGDLDGDGNTDIIGSMNGNIRVHWGDGTGDFSSFTNIAGVTSNGGRRTTSGDLNGDGIGDIAIGTSNGSSLNIRLGTGSRAFGSNNVYSLGSGGGRSVAMSDLDNDGNQDVIATVGSRIAVFLGNGDGTLQTRVDYNVGNNAYDVIAADFNGDGNQDLASVGRDDNTVHILIGNGNGTFQSSVSYAVNSTPEYLKASDIDNDGALDIVATSEGSNNASILMGNGDGSFSAKQDLAIGSESNSFDFGDIDGDGVQDLLIASSNISDFVSLTAGTKEGLKSQSLGTASDALEALDYYTEIGETININRSTIAAFQVRIEVAIKNLDSSVLEYSNAESAISDADIAKESAKLVANQILQQSGASVLAQANQQPSLVLSLLGSL